MPLSSHVSLQQETVCSVNCGAAQTSLVHEPSPWSRFATQRCILERSTMCVLSVGTELSCWIFPVKSKKQNISYPSSSSYKIWNHPISLQHVGFATKCNAVYLILSLNIGNRVDSCYSHAFLNAATSFTVKCSLQLTLLSIKSLRLCLTPWSWLQVANQHCHQKVRIVTPHCM